MVRCTPHAYSKKRTVSHEMNGYRRIVADTNIAKVSGLEIGPVPAIPEMCGVQVAGNLVASSFGVRHVCGRREGGTGTDENKEAKKEKRRLLEIPSLRRKGRRMCSCVLLRVVACCKV
ncbi:hypothetical protein ACMFMG_006292 [Clarireedia jacksonii]